MSNEQKDKSEEELKDHILNDLMFGQTITVATDLLKLSTDYSCHGCQD